MPTDMRHGVRTCWSRFGQGSRSALLLHCSLAHQGAWSGVTADLDDLFTFTAFDFPGHGRSGDWDGRSDYHTISTVVARSFLGDEPVDLIGHSFGATVALRLALEAPERVRSMVLIEPVLFAAAAGSPLFDDVRADKALLEERLMRDDVENAARAFSDIWGTGQAWQDQSESQRNYAMARLHLIVAGAAALHDDTAGLLAPGRPEGVRAPVLMLEGERSPPIISAILNGLSKRLPLTQRKVIAGAGHMLPITHPEQTARAIREFASETLSA